MRVELIYAPGCLSYRKALHTLETVIAEERLPVPIELVEENDNVEPFLRIDGEAVGTPKVLTCMETLRDTLSTKWTELTVSPLLRGY